MTSAAHPAATVCALACALALSAVQRQSHESTSCQSNIVSATVVATFCGHQNADEQVLDLFILWRGNAGWFQRREMGWTGSAGSREFGGGTNGRVYESTTYGDTNVAYFADFDARTLDIEGTHIVLGGVNTIFVDGIDREKSTITSRLFVEPRIPLAGDPNLDLARRSKAIRAFLQCAIAMPAPPRTRHDMAVPQPPVLTVCEKLQRAGRPDRTDRDP